MRFVGFVMSLKDSHTRGLGLLQQVQGFHEGELQLFNAGIEVLFAAESAGVLKQRHYGSAPLVRDKRVRIDGCLRRFAVLFPFVDDNRT